MKSDKDDIFQKKENWDSTIMFATSIYPKISIFIEIGQSWFCEMAASLKN